jgi:hypothetical protein
MPDDDYISSYYSMDNEPDDIEYRGSCLGDILASVTAWVFILIFIFVVVALLA